MPCLHVYKYYDFEGGNFRTLRFFGSSSSYADVLYLQYKFIHAFQKWKNGEKMTSTLIVVLYSKLLSCR